MKRNLPEGVKQTSGGRFDPFQRHVYFMASSSSYMENIHTSIAPFVLVAVNELKSPEELRAFESMIRDGKSVLLDSGIFSLANNHAKKHHMTHSEALNLAPTDIDGFDSLYDRYCTIVTKYQESLWGVIELDQGGARNKRVTRAKLESDIPGFVPIPVYHPLGDGVDYFDELATGYDRMCCGNIVQASPPDRMRLQHLFYERARAYPYLWTHILGYTPTGTTLSIPPQGSCDSSTWCGPLRWGIQSTKPKAMNTPVGRTWYGTDLNRDPDVEPDHERGYNTMKRWSAYRSHMMWRTWETIERTKQEYGLTLQPEAQ